MLPCAGRATIENGRSVQNGPTAQNWPHRIEIAEKESRMGKGGRKRRARKKNKANHGKRPNT